MADVPGSVPDAHDTAQLTSVVPAASPPSAKARASPESPSSASRSGWVEPASPRRKKAAQPPPEQGTVAEIVDFLKYWFSPQKSDIKSLRAKHEEMRAALGAVLSGDVSAGVGDLSNLHVRMAQGAANAVMDVHEASVDHVVDTANEVKDTIVSLAEDTLHTGLAGVNMLTTMKDFVQDGITGKMSITDALDRANLLKDVPQDVQDQMQDALKQFDDVTIDDLYSSKVDGPEAEKLMVKRWPVFIVVTTAFTSLLWFIKAQEVAGEDGATKSWMDTFAGLETVYPGETMMQLHRGCDDQRSQMYRWLSYQFSHSDVYHIGQNAFMTLLLGLPLEGFHGSWRMLIMFNLGVFGGACSVAVWEAHRAVVGMSGGVYALIGMHVADVVMNWHQKRYRKAILAVLIFLFVVDMVNAYVISSQCASHAAHFGGYCSGIMVGILLGVNLVVTKLERRLRAITLVVAVTLAVFCLVMGTRWPPQNLWEAIGSCEVVVGCGR